MGQIEEQQNSGQQQTHVVENYEAALKRIEEKLAIVEKKLSDKWILPVSLALLSSILTFGNYFVQRLFLNSDVFRNETNKLNAGFKAKSTSEFYKQCYGKLDSIDKSFQSYCQISPSSFEDSIMTAKQIQLTALVDRQFPIDPKVKKRLQDYINFVADKLVDFGDHKPNNIVLNNTYLESKQIYNDAVAEINSAFLDPGR